MRNLISNTGKIIRFIIVFILLLHCVGKLKAQNIDFKCTIDSEYINDSYKYQVNITVTGGEAPLSYYLYDNLPLNNGKLIVENKGSDKSSCTFNNLTSLRYYICVVDNKKRIKGEWVRKM